MTTEVNRLSKRAACPEAHLPWTYLTCSLEVEEECKEKGKVGRFFFFKGLNFYKATKNPNGFASFPFFLSIL